MSVPPKFAGHDESILFEKTYGVHTPDLRQMCDDMVCRGVTEAAMESTAVYWVPVWNELCESMELKLVNPYFIKQLPGSKSDIRGAQWIAESLLKNLIRGSLFPEPFVQYMRKLTRRIFDLQCSRTHTQQACQGYHACRHDRIILHNGHHCNSTILRSVDHICETFLSLNITKYVLEESY